MASAASSSACSRRTGSTAMGSCSTLGGKSKRRISPSASPPSARTCAMTRATSSKGMGVSVVMAGERALMGPITLQVRRVCRGMRALRSRGNGRHLGGRASGEKSPGREAPRVSVMASGVRHAPSDALRGASDALRGASDALRGASDALRGASDACRRASDACRKLPTRAGGSLKRTRGVIPRGGAAQERPGRARRRFSGPASVRAVTPARRRIGSAQRRSPS
jgi:hypothetical protein